MTKKRQEAAAVVRWRLGFNDTGIVPANILFPGHFKEKATLHVPSPSPYTVLVSWFSILLELSGPVTIHFPSPTQR